MHWLLWDAMTGTELQAFEGSKDIRTISFLVDGSHLQTDRGYLRLNSYSGNVLPQSDHLFELFVRDEWISRRNVKLLWLPKGHRPVAMAVCENIIVMGY